MRHVEHNVLSAREDFAQRMDTLEDSISAKLSNLSECIRVSSLAPQTAPTFTATRQSTSCTTSIPNHQHLTASAPLQPVPAPTEVSQPLSTQPLQHDQEDTIPDELRAEAQLGNETFVFNKTEVPDPPAILFSKDIDRLFHEWEDSTLLCVNGRNIPIKYWPEFYKKSKGVKENAWGALRTKWDNWKVRSAQSSVPRHSLTCLKPQFIVTERQAHSDNTSFWRKFSDSNGQRLGYQKVLQALKKERKAIATHHATNARTFFGGNLDHPDAGGAFRYVRTGQWLVCTEEDAIAQRWLKLLQDRPDLAATWSSSQNTSQQHDLAAHT
jgi:hypothetical protein